MGKLLGGLSNDPSDKIRIHENIKAHAKIPMSTDYRKSRLPWEQFLVKCAFCEYNAGRWCFKSSDEQIFDDLIFGKSLSQDSIFRNAICMECIKKFFNAVEGRSVTNNLTLQEQERIFVQIYEAGYKNGKDNITHVY